MNKRKTCSFPKCERPYHAKGFCKPHYYQQYNDTKLRPILSRKRRTRDEWQKYFDFPLIRMKKITSSRGFIHVKFLVACQGSRYIAGHALNCKKNFWIWLSNIRRRKTISCKSCCHYKGGYINANGYKRQQGSNGFILEHRLVMEQKLGRKLRKEETVHHINGKRADNRLKNLELRLAGNHPKGISRQDAAKWLRSTGAKVKL